MNTQTTHRNSKQRECILEVLTDIQTWNDAFQIKVQSVSAVDSEICSKTEIIVVSIPCSLHLLQCLIGSMMERAVECGVDYVILIFCVVYEPV